MYYNIVGVSQFYTFIIPVLNIDMLLVAVFRLCQFKLSKLLQSDLNKNPSVTNNISNFLYP